MIPSTGGAQRTWKSLTATEVAIPKLPSTVIRYPQNSRRRHWAWATADPELPNLMVGCPPLYEQDAAIAWETGGLAWTVDGIASVTLPIIPMATDSAARRTSIVPPKVTCRA
ncbi:hypothetical protein Vlu01_34070 [Micromonospora lutea]|uniref:Uncharacterized protein n=1 Tax=Micromonospora lutea TaxID=419825 RepID=A0ABQ4IXX8_9ACTN|nr:hypothetical protein Vlu01_34070 [Micromonospora lutea]